MIIRKFRASLLGSLKSHVALQTRDHSIISQLRGRELVKTITSHNLEEVSSTRSIGLYCGVDPTAPSLHVGNLLTLIPVLHFFLQGHNAVALVGGATGQVGDPAGKSKEREKLAKEALHTNVSALSAQLVQFFENAKAYASRRGYSPARFGTIKVVNNADWYAPLTFLQFLNDVGRNVRISSMLARDSVKNRLADDGMNFSEFTYQLLQAYDFWHLHKAHNVRLQIGGSDQYGNITAGIDLIARLQASSGEEKKNDQEVFGLTVPLLTTAAGEKFGKSAGNAIWLNPRMTSPFNLFQYFLKTQDNDLISYLQRFTLLSLDTIEAIHAKHVTDVKKRTAARILASEVTELVHGQEALTRVITANRVLFPEEYAEEGGGGVLSAETIKQVFQHDPALRVMSRDSVVDARVTKLLRDIDAVSSGKEARQLILNGGVRCGTHVVRDIRDIVDRAWLTDDSVLIVKIGKNRFKFVQMA